MNATLPNRHSHPHTYPLQGFLRKVVLASPGLKDKYAAIQRERLEAEAGAGEAMDTA